MYSNKSESNNTPHKYLAKNKVKNPTRRLFKKSKTVEKS